MESLDNYNEAFEEIVKEFVKKYYTYDDWSYQDYYIIWGFWRHAPDTVEINWDFWDITNIYEALKHDLDKGKLFERYEYSLNKAHINSEWWKEIIVNLINFCKWAIEYTEEDKKKDEEKIKETRKLLFNSIKQEKCKKK